MSGSIASVETSRNEHQPMTPRDSTANLAVSLAESGRLPDAAVRWGMRRVIEARLRSQRQITSEDRLRLRQEAWSGPIALSTDVANQQHYEVPSAFFELVLGARLKYSSAYWPDEATALDDAELAMLDLYSDRAGLADGQAILDLGCGWGSFSLWAAEQFPNSQVVGVSNSHSQAARITQVAANRGLSNIEVVTDSVNDYTTTHQFDRIVSVEMLEHVRNHRALFERAAQWLRSDGAMFIHVFAHRDHFYTFDVEGPGNWMARTFFTGGLMPSSGLLRAAATPYFDRTGEWWINGTHYSKTLETWLSRLDSEIEAVRDVLGPIYGSDVDVWIRRWRMFFMACSEMFAMRDGEEWGVLHQLFLPSRSG
jgi:cyclopropane-fatty-acyl-phospholipid synthase